MIVTSDEYFFYEWLILCEDISAEEFKDLTSVELQEYYKKYEEWKRNETL